MSAILDWANDPRVLNYLKTHDPRGVVENGDYIRPQQDWGKTFEELHPNGKHLLDAGNPIGVNPLPSGKLLTAPTLSNESPFAEGKGGTWTELGQRKWQFEPSEWMKENHDMNSLKKYFKQNEKGNVLKF